VLDYLEHRYKSIVLLDNIVQVLTLPSGGGLRSGFIGFQRLNH